MSINRSNTEPDYFNQPGTNEVDIEGLDSSKISGWGEYPLDSVFVRKEQRTVSEVVKRIKSNRFILDPEFQRDFIWPLEKQSRLIESCLMRLPLPVFYVAEGRDGRIIVVDGLQRLNTFKRYLGDEFSLSKLGDGQHASQQDSPLVGKKFSALPINLQERIEDTQLTLYILDPKAPERAKLDFFDRVIGGGPLTRQQMRNCLFNGEATRWLKRASINQDFLQATGKSLNERSMRDREAINRFCAFTLLGVEKYESDMDDFLARSLEQMNSMSEKSLKDLEDKFGQSMRSNYFLFKKHAFRKSILAQDPEANRTVLKLEILSVSTLYHYGVAH